jgi:hypothetical protein
MSYVNEIYVTTNLTIFTGTVSTVNFTQQTVRYLQVQSAQSTFDNKLTARGSEVSRGRQF